MENLQNNQIIAFLLFIGLCIALTLPVIVLKYKEFKAQKSKNNRHEKHQNHKIGENALREYNSDTNKH
ncbi:hypothetical protein [Helicobacter bilis]|uniref:hypothetical protein n=1 Tax=Helicobacter bilis TaxID=37372 RepID=UPI00248E076B|nr:hypothetical protein [Helicobacter bilis]